MDGKIAKAMAYDRALVVGRNTGEYASYLA